MSDITPLGWTVMLLAAILLVALIGYALSLSRQLNAQRRLSEQREASYQALAAKRNIETRDSIAAVCQAMISRNMVPTESALRINYLATQTTLAEHEEQTLAVFIELAEQTSHLPIREAWDALDKPTKKKLTRERELLEASLLDRLELAANNWLSLHKPQGIVH